MVYVAQGKRRWSRRARALVRDCQQLEIVGCSDVGGAISTAAAVAAHIFCVVVVPIPAFDVGPADLLLVNAVRVTSEPRRERSVAERTGRARVEVGKGIVYALMPHHAGRLVVDRQGVRRGVVYDDLVRGVQDGVPFRFDGWG